MNGPWPMELRKLHSFQTLPGEDWWGADGSIRLDGQLERGRLRIRAIQSRQYDPASLVTGQEEGFYPASSAPRARHRPAPSQTAHPRH